MSKDDVVTTTKALEALDLLDEDGQMASTQAYHTLLRYIHQQDRRALSHAAGQDGEQCRAASVSTDNEFIGEAMGRLADEVEKPGSKVTITKADACAIGIYVRALSRGVPEGE